MTPYFNICVRITIDDNVIITQIESLNIESATENITDKAKITLPREYKNAVIKNTTRGSVIAGNPVLNFLKVGSKIKIEGGYDDKYNTEFEGYITSVHADIPLVVECEDETWMLKRTEKFNKTFANATLKEVLRYIAPKHKIETFEEERPLGKLMIEQATAFDVLMQLRDKYFIRSFFRDGVLHAGLPVNLKAYKIHQFNLNRNVRRGTDLTYQTRESRKMYIKAKSLQKGTSKYVYAELGDKDGEVKELDTPMNLTKEEVRKFAQEWYDSYSYDGYSGSFSSWAIPQTRAGDTADITDPNYPDGHRDGMFYITGVTVDISAGEGYKRTNKIAKKLSGNKYDTSLKK